MGIRLVLRSDVVKTLHQQSPKANGKEAASVSTVGNAVDARSAEEAASVSTGDDAVCARSAEGAASVSMSGSAVGARNARATRCDSNLF